MEPKDRTQGPIDPGWQASRRSWIRHCGSEPSLTWAARPYAGHLLFCVSKNAYSAPRSLVEVALEFHHEIDKCPRAFATSVQKKPTGSGSRRDKKARQTLEKSRQRD